MAAKLRIRFGPVELEYEGEIEFDVADIKGLFSHVETAFKVLGLAEGSDACSRATPEMSTFAKNEDEATGSKLHVNSIARQLKAKTGPEVAIAAAARLQVYEGKENFSRTELLDTMKKATMYYGTNMSGNLTKILATLVGSKFNQSSDGKYSLTADEYQNLGQLLT